MKTQHGEGHAGGPHYSVTIQAEDRAKPPKDKASSHADDDAGIEQLLLPSAVHHKDSHEAEEERKVTRLEMWIDALASIVVTLAVLPMMELLNEPKDERELGIPFLIFTAALGFAVMSYILVNTYLVFNWFDHRHVTDPILLALGLFFIACLSLFFFGLQSIMQLYRDTTTVFFIGGIFIGIYASCFFIFLYCLRVTDISKRLRRSAIWSEVAFYVLVITVFIIMMIVSSFLDEDYQKYVVYGVLISLSVIHHCTRTESSYKLLLPKGHPQERIDVFTDGVYAVAVTLFLIEIRYPTHVSHEESLAKAFLKEEWRSVVGHFSALVVLGAHWIMHNFLSAMDTHHTSTSYGLSMGHSMAAALFPFTIKLSLKGEYGGWEIAAPLLCWAELVLTQLLLWLRARKTLNEKWTKWLSIIAAAIVMIVYLVYEVYVGTK